MYRVYLENSYRHYVYNSSLDASYETDSTHREHSDENRRPFFEF